MKRVVVTGIGIVSSLGNNCQEVLESLKNLKSGIEFDPVYQEMGLRSNVAGNIKIDTKEHIDRKAIRFMGDAAAFTYIAMKEAIENAGLTPEMVSNPRTGIVAGSGGASSSAQVEAADILREKGVKRIGPYGVTKTMASTVSACLATHYQIKGVNYSISSACSTSAHCIGNAAELIQLGKQDIVFAGGGEEVSWQMSMLFDAMGAMSSKYNDAPQTASRAYDADRDGFVISGGGSILVLEEYEHAKARGAKILCEITGYGATSDGYDMVQPSGEGAVRCMEMALAQHGGKVDYINAHGTSTPVGDTKELEAIRKVFNGKDVPFISSTKSLSGHALGAAGSNEAIYSILMMQNDFVCASANIQNIDEEAVDLPILRENKQMKLDAVMSNSFGFGGTNATLIFSRV
ncbi:beta-ketoacyl-ACP synthase I [Neisseria wadsworthii]|uniref:3-oxoacyl-[acyl-carrier-protein] synthase 1 n=1 Tax=Neisseria wadsworthii 9715 TaxID=1030841 RepID=G4CRT0_9NEIS|nr:beta-ketoacyl-ACP synthase I [Neisseria wadsworthii]EGZ45231.1 3-oxoacyl-[acyl-carrier-protein] synthase I [Neisseria wadsworthii 9715]QMT35463.1 beta-ketoacyl-ACP synthase I [Neisseria wadsworthii]